MKLLKTVSVYLKQNRTYAGKYVPWRGKEVVEQLREELEESKKREPVRPKKCAQRVSESDPTNHTLNDVGKYYTLPKEDVTRLFQLGGRPKAFAEQCKTFNETSIMIRKPALEIIDLLKRANYDKLPLKFVIYGQIGTGKTIQLLHVIHYAAVNNFIIFNVPYVPVIFKYGRRENQYSETRKELIDLPLEGAVLLKHFQLQNGALIKKLDLRTTREYVWNLRESTPAGTPLMTLINHGINRIKYSCDCIHGLVHELKTLATQGQCRLLVAIDGFNSMISARTMVRPEYRERIPPQKLSLVDSFLTICQADWSNGAIVVVVSERATTPQNRGNCTPFFLLKRQGFELLDPLVPIEVPPLSEQEFHSLLDYYQDRLWLQKEGGREEIEFITTRNPQQIMEMCAPL